MQTQDFFWVKFGRTALAFVLFIIGTSMINVDVSPNGVATDRKTVVVKGGKGIPENLISAIYIVTNGDDCVDPYAPFFIDLVNPQNFELNGLMVNVKVVSSSCMTNISCGIIDLDADETEEIVINLPNCINNSSAVKFVVEISQSGIFTQDDSTNGVCPGGGNSNSQTH